MDLTNLSPAPWSVYKCSYCEAGSACGLNEQSFDLSYDECHHPLHEVEAEFIVLARNAFDVMIRRGWSPIGGVLMSSSGYVHVGVEEILRETDAAFLCRIEGEDVWLPRSQIADPDDYEVGDSDLTMSITEWLAREKGLGE